MAVDLGWRVVAHVASVPVLGLLAVVAWRNRTTRGSGKLTALLASIVAWNALAPVTVGVESVRATTFFGGLMLVTLGLVVYSLLTFTLTYSGREDWLTPRRHALLLVHPVALLALTLTDAHVGIAPGPLQNTLLFADVTLAPTEFYGTESSWGDAFWVHLVYSYALVAASTYFVVDLVKSSTDAYDGQGWLLVGGIAVPWVANVLDVFTPLLDDTLGLAFCVTGVMLFVGVRSHELSGVTPVARTEVLESLDGGVVVLDADDRVVDLNEAAMDLIGVDDAVLGRPAEAAFDHLDDLWSRYESVYDTEDELAFETDDGWRHFSVRISRLEGSGSARSVLINDVTERVRREQKLENQKERLDQFASILSHDLRNPLNVAQGRLEMVEDDSENVAAVERSHDRIETLIDEVLTLARSGRTVSETEAVDVDDLATEAWATVDTGDVDLVVETEASVEADPERLRTAFENCFRNTVDHGGPDLSTVWVGTVGGTSVFSRDDRGLFVADDGTGIPADERARALEAGHTTEPGGTGLGLSIVDSVADGHGWSLELTESRSGGARVEFRGVILEGDGSEEGSRAEEAEAVSDD